MRELHGVMCFDWAAPPEMKHSALFFDKVHVLGLDDILAPKSFMPALPESVVAEYHFLAEHGFLQDAKEPSLEEDSLMAARRMYGPQLGFLERQIISIKLPPPDDPNGFDKVRPVATALLDYMVRVVSANMATAVDVVPICRTAMPPINYIDLASRESVLLRVGTDVLPVPGDDCSWQDIFDFKVDLQDKQWAFRRFLKTLSTRSQTEVEIRDDLEWTLNEYSKAMELHHIKASQSFVDVFVITPLEIIENLVKFNWSKIAKGALQVRKLKVELLEAEMKAPGRECAYVFDAQKRFAPK